MPDVVAVGPTGGPIAAGPPAGAVTRDDRAALGGGERARGAASIEDLGLRADHDAADVRVAAHPLQPDAAGGRPVPIAAGRSAGAVFEPVERGKHGDVRFDPAGL